jgi:hypothetical protein
MSSLGRFLGRFLGQFRAAEVGLHDLREWLVLPV